MQLGREARDKLLTYAHNRGVARDVAARVLDVASRAARDWGLGSTDFLTPPESAALQPALAAVPDVRCVAWGGYADAERRVFLIAHAETVADDEMVVAACDERVVVLKVRGDFAGDKATHRDFLGAVLGAGVTRQKVGDILVHETQGADIVLCADIAVAVSSALTTVRSVAVHVEQTSTSELEVPPRRIKLVTSVEASLRIDAVASAALPVSRSRVADMAKSGLVMLNYRECRSASKKLSTGDVVSVRGVGKFEVGEVGTTAKGRFRVEMKRYV